MQKKKKDLASQFIKPIGRNAPLPLSYAQQRLWFLDQLEPQNPAYNLPSAVRLSGDLDIEALARSLSEILRRHEVLRTCFPVIDGKPVQEINKAKELSIDIIDLSSKPEDERALEANNIRREENLKPFDLARGPLIRAKLLRLNDKEYLLLVTMHHIVVDGLSIEVMLRELALLYKAFRAREISPLKDLKIQYADYAAWQRDRLQGEAIEEQIGYWKKQLEDMPILDLTTDYVRGAANIHQGARERFTLSETATRGLKKLGQKEGATLFMTLLAAFQVLLARYSEQDDIGVGTDVANRNRPETKNLIGFFVNQLVLRTNLSGNPSFRELLRRVCKMALEAYLYQDLPFEKLVEDLAPKRNLPHSPFFRVKTTLQHKPKVRFELQGLQISVLEYKPEIAKIDLELIFRESRDELEVDIEYSADLFHAERIKRLAGHMQTLLQYTALSPDQKIWEMDLLTSAEREQALIGWNRTVKEYPLDQCLPQLFKAQVEARPEAIALVYEKQELSYLELNQRANQLAHYLRARGAGPELLVGVYVERSIDMVVGLLGILKAGAGYVSLDVNSPKRRLEFMLQDSGVRTVLTQERLRPALPSRAAEVICLDRDWDEIRRWSSEEIDSEVRAENVAYAIYTSGSTGYPKGVLGLHRGVVNRCHWMWETYPFEEGEICCQKTSLGFVDSVWEIFGPLLHGTPSVIIPDSVIKDVRELVETLKENRITRLVLVPSLLSILLEHCGNQLARTDIKLWISSGEKLESTLIRRFAEIMPQGRLLNLYGSSEVSADVSWEEPIQAVNTGREASIGRPIVNNHLYILDRCLQPKPVGVWGELYVGGEGLGRGYLQRPDLTAERFIPHPFSGAPGQRLYRTGDLARYQTDGCLDFLGRIDHQVKIRGYRIELGEIEAGLMEQEGIRAAAAVVREDERQGKQIVGYVVLEKRASLKPDEVKRLLKEKLPAYMVPAVILELEQFPLTSSGKVDRRALPRPSQDGLDIERNFVAPRTSLEETLALIWSEALGVRPVGVNNNFFDLGGHSLLATQIMSRVREACYVDIPLRRLFEGPTVADLAIAVVQAQAEQISDDELDHLFEEYELMQ